MLPEAQSAPLPSVPLPEICAGACDHPRTPNLLPRLLTFLNCPCETYMKVCVLCVSFLILRGVWCLDLSVGCLELSVGCLELSVGCLE